MAEINQKERTVKVKIVYYGPPLGGKTTNLQVLHRHAMFSRRGEMISINSFQDRTILFDLLPINTVGLRGFDLRLQLVAVPGQANYSATRRVALKGADGVVFVANSAEDRWNENLTSLRELTQYLVAQQLDPASIPLVFQYNKRDLPAITPLNVMDCHLNGRKEEAFPAVAVSGQGALETLAAILARTLQDVSRRFRTLELPKDLTPLEWSRQAIAGIFGRHELTEPPDDATRPGTSAEGEFGIPREVEFDPATLLDLVEPAPADTRVIRVPMAETPAPGKDLGARGNGTALTESYAEACAELASNLAETRAERDLDRRRLEGIRRAVATARRMSSTDAEAQLQRILASLGEGASAAHATVALWEAAREAEQQLERQRDALYQSQKLAAMGTLLAGVAHELNNPLSIILGQVELLRRAAGTSSVRERADKIARAGERCSRIVRNFLALARQRPEERQRMALNQVIEEALELLAYPLRVDNVELKLDLAHDLPPIWADPNQIHQVIVNLVSNAQQAMRETTAGRQIAIATRFEAARSRVLFRVSDTGPGIPPEIQSRIFEPFFTTKAPGEGTGLGLSLCHGIVEAHGGLLRLQSQPGQGATFTFDLPAGVGPERRLSTAEVPARVHPGKMILVVDDEPELSETLAEMLSADGHHVETAPNGQVALGKIQQHAYDVIVSDLKMPVLDGPGLYRTVEEQHPDLLDHFIFITGDMVSPEAGTFLDGIGKTSLGKPFDCQAVRRAVEAVGASPAVPLDQDFAFIGPSSSVH